MATDTINMAQELLSEIAAIKERHKNFRRGGRLDFSFFEGIVNSGKSEKTHIEKYHSNFIAYLLNPKSSHDCDALFLKKFLSFIKIKHSEFGIILNENEEIEKIKVERETRTEFERNMDITINKEHKWIVFIENKVWSAELYKQVRDYAEDCQKRYDDWWGIYLTPSGNCPDSIKDDDKIKEKIICLKYQDIIDWLKSCYEDLIYYPNITSALSQYINAINKSIYNMTSQESKDLVELIVKNPENIKSAIAINNSLGQVQERILERTYNYIKNYKNSEVKKVEKSDFREDGGGLTISIEVDHWRSHYIEIYLYNDGDCQIAILEGENKNKEQQAKPSEQIINLLKDIRSLEIFGWPNYLWVGRYIDWWQAKWWEKMDMQSDVCEIITQIITKIKDSGINL